MSSIEELQAEVDKIKKRNSRVEADKAWETSRTRKIVISGLTYIVIVIFFYIVDIPNPLISAIVPALAFFLSTLTVPVFKNFWLKYFYRK